MTRKPDDPIPYLIGGALLGWLLYKHPEILSAALADVEKTKDKTEVTDSE